METLHEQGSKTDQDSRRNEPEDPREGGLAVVLWLLAMVIAQAEAFAWLFQHMNS